MWVKMPWRKLKTEVNATEVHEFFQCDFFFFLVTVAEINMKLWFNKITGFPQQSLNNNT